MKQHVGLLLRILIGVVWSRGRCELDVDEVLLAEMTLMIRAIFDDRIRRSGPG